MSKMKYIVVKQGNILEPFVFSETVTHAELAMQVGGTVVSAGFCGLRDNQFRCWGESVSLRVASRGEEDDRIINRRMGLADDWL